MADMHTPDLIVHVEVRDFAAYVHANPTPGAGGLPVGVGRARRLPALRRHRQPCGLLDDGQARAGAGDACISSATPTPPTEAKEKVLDLARLLTPWCGRLTVHVVPFTEIQEELRRSCPEALFTLLMRRFMMRICRAGGQARRRRMAWSPARSLGQVASQTMEAMAVTGQVCTLPVFRPVIGMDKEEIIRIARKIGTFETSILPYEDCCTVFTPRHPKTRPTLEELQEAEAALDIDALVQKAVDGIEKVVLTP